MFKENRQRMKAELEEQISDLRETIHAQKEKIATGEKNLDLEKAAGQSAKRETEAIKAERRRFLEGSKLLYKIRPPKWFLGTATFISLESLGMQKSFDLFSIIERQFRQ